MLASVGKVALYFLVLSLFNRIYLLMLKANTGIPLPILFLGLHVEKHIYFPLQCNEKATLFAQ